MTEGEHMNIDTFLLARIAEDEEVARGCPPWPWRVATAEDEAANPESWAHETVVAADGLPVVEPYALSGEQTRSVRDHIARHDPARVVAGCEAKRRVVESYAAAKDCAEDEEWTTGYADGLHEAITILAQPYRDHPDFDPAWRLP